ncbi:uncharacterized protein PG998_010647 [Apiospora kogelbergensis]|uniref:uncharacterized protein n=1 Tax=Apiospora kogelbergensis TaxID=1337665 RepID=UPI0031324BD8
MDATHSILWFTWFVVCMFDVRFMTDSIFERVIRIVQFGSMAGFTIVVTKFDPKHQFDPDGNQETNDKRGNSNDFRTLSLILMAVRLSLVAQYCCAFWLHRQERHRRERELGRDDPAIPKPEENPLLAAAAIHFIAAMVYLGIARRFDNQHNSRVYLAWYIGSALEAILQFILAFRCDHNRINEIITFRGRKLTKRLAVFTLIILGEAISAITKNIVLVVENGKRWNSSTNGIFVSAVAITYFIYLLYFDWMNHKDLHGYRQIIYSLLHFPFHAALLLLGAGSGVFIKWWQAITPISLYDGEMLDHIRQIVERSESDIKRQYLTDKSTAIAEGLLNITLEINRTYPIQYLKAWEAFYEAGNITQRIPNSFWNSTSGAVFNKWYPRWEYARDKHAFSVYNVILTTFKLNPAQDEAEKGDYRLGLPKYAIQVETTFRYIYACAGIVLVLMTCLHVLTLTKRDWKPFDYVRVALFMLAGLGLGLVPVMSTDQNLDRAIDYIFTPYVLPTICLVVTCVFLVTHIHRPPVPIFARPGRKTRQRELPA